MFQEVLMVGCGGIGGILAAELTRAGVAVTPVTGNERIAGAIAKHGYRVMELDGATWSVRSSRPARANLPDGGPTYDLCMLGTKATTMREALASVAGRLAPGAPVVCLQNGLPEEIAALLVPRAQVVGCVVGWGATMIEPGVYQRTSRGGLQIGGSGDLKPVADLLARAETTSVVDDLAGVRWSKLAINCATSTLGAIGGQRLGALLRRRAVRRLVLEMWSEVVAVARAEKVRMALVGGTLDVARLALTPAERMAALGSPALAWKHSILMAVGMKYRRMRSSMLVALERGRIPEIDYLNGTVVDRAERHGIATPVNARLVEAVRAIVAGRERTSMEHLMRVCDELAQERAQARRAA
jgi:2-dehydropantoate 2-reductase